MKTNCPPVTLFTAGGLILLLAGWVGSAFAQSLIPNGSFETGEPPAGWHARSGGTVAKGGGIAVNAA
jgi:hypothetical protein